MQEEAGAGDRCWASLAACIGGIVPALSVPVGQEREHVGLLTYFDAATEPGKCTSRRSDAP